MTCNLVWRNGTFWCRDSTLFCCPFRSLFARFSIANGIVRTIADICTPGTDYGCIRAPMSRHERTLSHHGHFLEGSLTQRPLLTPSYGPCSCTVLRVATRLEYSTSAILASALVILILNVLLLLLRSLLLCRKFLLQTLLPFLQFLQSVTHCCCFLALSLSRG